MEHRLGLLLLCWTFRTSANQCGFNQQQRYHLLSDFDNVSMITPQRISELTSQTQQTCAHVCHDNNNCTMFNININDGQCLLYSASFPSVINSNYLDGVRLYGRASDTCPIAEGYIAFDNPPACYRLSLDKMNWTDAKADCEGDGDHLAVLDDMDKWQQVMAATDVFRDEEPFYVGLDDRVNEGTFVWADGREALSPFWDTNEPSLDPGDNEDCVMVYIGGLHDVTCDVANYYMCQIDITL